MSNIPTVGIFLPNGYLNNYNSASDTGQVDAYGNVYPSGSNVGKVIEVGDSLAAQLTKPGSTGGTYATKSGNPLFGGAYQIVQLDSGATAANVDYGLVAYIKLDSGVTQGALPETAYANIVVTDESAGGVSIVKSLFAGVFLNAVTPGNFGLIWVGAGRATVLYKASLTNGSPALGDNIATGGGSGTCDDAAANTTAPTGLYIGQAVTVPVGGAYGVIYNRNLFNRVPGV